MNDLEKKTVGVQLSPELYRAIQDLAADYGGNVSSTIRLILIDYLKRYTDYSKRKEIRK